jgi:hypothetical protein
MTELFALGSTVYEIMTGVKPYKELLEHEIYAAFSEGRYPDLHTVSVFRSTIMRCWSQSYATVDEALKEVKSEGTSNPDPLQYDEVELYIYCNRTIGRRNGTSSMNSRLISE